MHDDKTIRLGRRHVPPVPIPGEIFTVYQPVLGPKAVLLWLNLRWLAHTETTENIEEVLQERTGFDFRELTEGLSTLSTYGLLEFGKKGEYVLNEPLSAEAFALSYQAGVQQVAVTAEAATDRSSVKTAENTGKHAAADETAPVETQSTVSDAKLRELKSAQVNDKTSELQTPAKGLKPGEPGGSPEKTTPLISPLSRKNREQTPARAAETAPTPAPTPARTGDVKATPKAGRKAESDRSADVEAVVQYYHNKIGIMGPSQFEKLRFWVEDMGMDGEVVALAIEETVKSAKNPRIQYLEGILRNWHNDQIRTLQDLLKHKNASTVLSGNEEASASMEGVPNASAYQRVDPALVKKWKELYPDEYDG
ncbi:MAG: DnaD domain-containing protein [Limnochordia bacterium]